MAIVLLQRYLLILAAMDSQFGYYDVNETVVELHDQDIYTSDRIGLRTLDKTGRLHVVTVPGVNHFNWHMNVSIVDDFLLDYLD